MICRRELVTDLILTAAWIDLGWPAIRSADLRSVAAPLVRGGMGMKVIAPPALSGPVAAAIEETAQECLYLLGYDRLPLGKLAEHGELQHLTVGPRSAHDRLRAMRYFSERGMALPGP